MISSDSMNNTSLIFLVWLWLIPLNILYAQSSQPDKIPAYASVSALVIDIESGEELFNQDADRLLVPASLMKLVTTSVALEQLSPDYKFSTHLWKTGEVINGTLKGNIIVEGGGDPTLGSCFFPNTSPAHTWQKVRDMMAEAGIHRLEGSLLVDEHFFEAPLYPSPRLWEDMGNYYGAPPAPLTFRDNIFEVTLQAPPMVGALCQVTRVSPAGLPMQFVSRVTAASHQKDSAYIYGVPGLKEWEIRGSIPAGRAAFTIKGALPDPGIVFAREMVREVFKNPSVKVAHTSDTIWKQQASLLGRILSPSLSEIVKEINLQSNNLLADHLLPAITQKAGINTSFWDAGPNLLKQFWWDKGFVTPVEIFDGSGLAPTNALSARYLTQILTFMHGSKQAHVFFSSLPVSGSSGTLRNMWDKEPLKGRIHAKSGSMRNVMGYAGYAVFPGVSPKAFALIVNHHGLSTKEIKELIEAKLEDMLL